MSDRASSPVEEAPKPARRGNGNGAPARGRVGSGRVSRAIAPMLRTLRTPARMLGIPVGGAAALSTLWIGGVAFANGFWMIGLFEVVVLVAGVFAVLAGLGRFDRGPALSLASAGVAMGVLAVLAEPALVTSLLGTRGHPLEVGSVRILPFMVGRLVCGVLLVVGAVMVVWGRNAERSAGYAMRSALTGAGALVVGAVALWPVPDAGARGGVVGVMDRAVDALHGLPLLVSVVLVILAFFVALGLVSASGHCLIRSFEVGRLSDEASSGAAREGAARAAAA